MRQAYGRLFSVVGLFLLAQFALVHCFGRVRAPALAQGPPKKIEQRKKAAAGTRPHPRSATAASRLPGPVAGHARGDPGRRRARAASRSCATPGSSTSSSPTSASRLRAATRSRIGSRSRATARAARSWRRWARSSTPATWCCRSAAISRTTGSTSGPTSPRWPSTSSRPPQEVRAAAPGAARRRQGDAVGRQIHPLAARHRRRRDVAFFPQRARECAVGGGRLRLSPRSSSR